MRVKSYYFLYLIPYILFLGSCKPFKEAECTGVKGFKINKVDLGGIDADIQLGIKNPNSIGFSVYRSSFDVIYNGVNLGTAHSKKRVHIDANSEKAYTFKLKSDFKNANMMDIMKLANGGGKGGNVQIKGNMKAGKFYLKKKFPVDVKERVGM
ncbi:MAG: LEA type 2 family protein [Bacteroidota bacterium]|nr:LEA type 2 family protein [Bacteroidota bacterium]